MTSVNFLGDEFEPREKVNTMRVLHLAKLAQGGEGATTADNWAALYDTVKALLRPEDFVRFMDVTDREGVRELELYEFVGRMIGAVSERPTVQPSDSSAGPSEIPESSASRLEELATERWSGRPDLVLAATRTA